MGYFLSLVVAAIIALAATALLGLSDTAAFTVGLVLGCVAPIVRLELSDA